VEKLERETTDIAEYIKANDTKEPTVLEKLRREIEKDTKAAQSEAERVARKRADLEQGPVEIPKKGKDIEIDR
jgi:hypothetical protein